MLVLRAPTDKEELLDEVREIKEDRLADGDAGSR